MTTKLADVIVPEVFTPYSIQRTMELSELMQAGVIENNQEFDTLASGAGKVIEMPYWADLAGTSEVMNDTGALTPGGLTTGYDAARKQGRANAWAATGLSAYFSGDDPMLTIGDLVGAYWARDMQKNLLSTLKGVFAAASMAGNLHDISVLTGGAELITPEATVDATQKMGDAKGLLTAMAMHSAVEAYLAKQKFIVYETVEGKTDRVATYLGKRVIVDDSLPYDTGTKTATTYLFGAGAVALGNGSNDRIVPTEVDRDSLASSGEDYLINRRLFILHPRGIKWTETAVTGSFPSNAELETATNWTRVYDNKAIRIVAFKHKIA